MNKLASSGSSKGFIAPSGGSLPTDPLIKIKPGGAVLLNAGKHLRHTAH